MYKNLLKALDEKTMRSLIEGAMQYDVIVSIPVTAGLDGPIEATVIWYPNIKERMMNASKPIRVTPICKMGKKAFVYGETAKMKDDPEYLESFVRMSGEFCGVWDIMGMRY